MSQEKVDRYKEQKKNRKKIMKQEKCKRYLGYTATVVVIALIIGWAGFSIYKNHEANKPVSYTEVDLSALTDYYSNLQVDKFEWNRYHPISKSCHTDSFISILFFC